MNWNSCKIFCVYPQDRTTRFLNRIATHLENNLGGAFHCFKVKPNEDSHRECLSLLNSFQNKLILFLGHGRSDKLFGASTDLANSAYISEQAGDYHVDYYKNDSFIAIENSSVFANNIVFSLSCDSNEKRNGIGVHSVSNGAISFIGFGDIQTDYDNTRELTRNEIAIFKGTIVKIVKQSLLYSINKNYTVEKLVDTMKVMTNKEIYKLLTTHKGNRHRYRISQHLFRFKEDVEIFGKRFTTLLSE